MTRRNKSKNSSSILESGATAKKPDNAIKLICAYCKKEVDSKKAIYPCLKCNRPCHQACKDGCFTTTFECINCPNEIIDLDKNASTSTDQHQPPFNLDEFTKKFSETIMQNVQILLNQQLKIFDEKLSQLTQNNFVGQSNAQSSPVNSPHTSTKNLNEILNEEDDGETSSTSSRDHAIEILAQTLQEISSNNAQQIERQNKLDTQNIYNELPVVNNVGLEWNNFYNLYTKSRKYFENAQNVVRLQKAIKCPKLLQAGGANLFNENTYHQAIEFLNDRFNRPFDVLRDELKKLISKKSPNKDDYTALVDYFTAVIQYAELQKNIGNINTQSDSGILTQIVEKLPSRYKFAWNALCATEEKLIAIATSENERQRHTITVMTLSEFLQKDFAALTRMISMQNSNNEKKSNENSRNLSRSFNHSSNFSNAWQYQCTLCVTNEHDIWNCDEAKKLSGHDLFQIMKKRNVCCLCLREEFQGKNSCTKPSPPECKYPSHKGQFHYPLLCALRKTNSDTHAPVNVHHNPPDDEQAIAIASSFEDNKDTKSAVHVNTNIEQNSSSLDDHKYDLYSQQNTATQRENFYLYPKNGEYPTTSRDFSNMHTYARSGSLNNNDYVDQTMTTAVNLLPVVTVMINESIVSFLIDTGSTISLIEESVANELKIRGISCPVNLRWSGTQTKSDENSRIIKVKAKSLHDNYSHTMHFHTFKDLNVSPQTLDAEEMKSRYEFLRPLSLRSYKKINGILGQDQAQFLITLQTFQNPQKDCEYVGVRSPLGDYVMGNRDSAKNMYEYLSKNCKKMSKNNHNTQSSSKQSIQVNYVYNRYESVNSNSMIHSFIPESQSSIKKYRTRIFLNSSWKLKSSKPEHIKI